MFQVGDRVRITEDAGRILRDTCGFPGWNDSMEEFVGEVFVISSIDSNGYIRFGSHSGNPWSWIAECLEFVDETIKRDSPIIRKIRYLNTKFYKKQLAKGKNYALCMLQ